MPRIAELRLKAGPSPADNKDVAEDRRLAEACRAFEGFLMGEMLKTMRDSGAGQKGLLPLGTGESIFLRQQSEALGTLLAHREPLGIARMLRQALGGQSAGARRSDR